MSKKTTSTPDPTHYSILRIIMTLEFNSYKRKPFFVDAVEVTTENIAEIAPMVGELRTKDDGTPYILVDRRILPNIHRVYPGFWMTKMGDNIRCYSGRIFKEQFEPTKKDHPGQLLISFENELLLD
jgi:hypothetical protein